MRVADLTTVIGSYTPLTVSGAEWHGQCPFSQPEGKLAVIGGKWQCYAHGCHEARDDAVGFLMLAENVTADIAEAMLAAQEFTPTLLKPTPPPKPNPTHEKPAPIKNHPAR